jgi:hypothetical protein
VARPDAEPMAALRVIRYVESAAANARQQIHPLHPRRARGRVEVARHRRRPGPWPRRSPAQIPLAEVAYEHAAGEPERAWSDTSFPWTCSACAGLIIDRGPAYGGGPEDDEPGHAQGCTAWLLTRSGTINRDRNKRA